MSTTICKSFTFEASHFLPRVPEGHKCHRMHGHSYELQLELTGAVDPVAGWVQDFGEISRIVKPIINNELDHRFLNEIHGLENPTAELIAKWIWDRLKPQLSALSKVRLSETRTSWCEYTG
ncbi:MAG TPA: 6-carboxytetrahydropterin synthase QueD [Fibrobacteraceae bacterium]|nr:6-carboxytetrahydropterin synthase QueD [Fibrobacteraceae bacterium]